jgi:hypothetical protein
MKTTYSMAAVGCALVLSACGGGGGSSGGGSDTSGTTGSTPVQTSTLSPIAAADAPKVASNAFDTSVLITDSSGDLTAMFTGASVAPVGVSVVSPVLGLVKKAYANDSAEFLTGGVMSQACAGGGTVTVSSVALNQYAASNGDKMTITATNCTESGITMNGVLSITVSGVSGDILNSTTGNATLDGYFEHFSATSGSTTETLNGDMKIGLAMVPGTLTIAISGASLQSTEQRSGATVATRTLTSYQVNGNVKGSTVTSAASFSVTGTANGLGQFAYTVKNLQPFVTTTTGMPTAGSLVVSGASATVTATVVSNGVRVDYSARGDGVITQTSTLSWSDFATVL